MSIYRPNNYQVNTGRIVDPSQSLRTALSDVGNIYQGYVDDIETKRARSVQEQRQAEQDKMARELHGARMGEIQEAQDKKEFLRSYTPDTTGGKYLDPTAARSFAEGTAPSIERTLSEYGVGEGGRTIGQLSEKEQQELGSRLGSLGISERMADVPATREAAYNSVYREVLQETADPVLADTLAKGESARLLGREDILAQEQKAVKGFNEQLEAQKETIKYGKEQRDKEYKQNLDRLKALNSASNKNSPDYKKDAMTVIQEAGDLPIGWLDNRQAQIAVSKLLDMGYEPGVISYTLRNNVRKDFWGSDVGEDDIDMLRAQVDRDARTFDRSNKDPVSALRELGTPTLTDEQQSILRMVPRVERGYSDIMRSSGEAAAGRGRLPVRQVPVQQNRVETVDRPQRTEVSTQPVSRRQELVDRLTRTMPVVDDQVVEGEDWQDGSPVSVMDEIPSLYTDSLLAPEDMSRLRNWLRTTR